MVFKKIVTGLLILIAVIGVSLAVLKSNSYDVYEEASHVKTDEVLAPTGNKTVYYYYQDTCHFCN